MSATSPNKIVKSSRAALSWRRRETVAVVPSVPLLSHLSAAGSVPTPNQPRKGSSEVDKERERETTRASAESESRSTLEAGVGSASESSRRGEKRENMVVRALLNRIAEELPSAQSQDAAGQSRNTTSQILRASAREIEAVASTYLAEVVEGLLRELEAISKVSLLSLCFRWRGGLPAQHWNVDSIVTTISSRSILCGLNYFS